MATLESVATYIDAAQTAFSSGDYTESRKQIRLARMENAKLPASNGGDGLSIAYRDNASTIDAILRDIDSAETENSGANVGARRNWSTS